MKSTFEEHAKQFQQEWKPMNDNNSPETTHDLQMARFTEQFHADPTVAQLADVLTTANESKRDAVKAALAGSDN